MKRFGFGVLYSVLVLGLGLGMGSASAEPTADEAFRQRIGDEARALDSIAEHEATKDWLGAAERLPMIEPRTIWHKHDEAGRVLLTDAAYQAAATAEQDGFEPFEVRASRMYYETRYGSPMVYLRAIDLAAGAHDLGDDGFAGERVLDFGYGQIGQLRMLAMLGAHVVGVEVDDLLRTVYSEPGDTGDIAGIDGAEGSITLAHGLWPADDQVAAKVGGGFDAIIARNVLKRGYVNPRRESPYPTIELGIDFETLPGRYFDALKPGGVMVIYNLGGTPGGEERYIPATDIDDPWSVEDWEAAGFEVVAHEAEESEAARAVGRALGWEDQGMNLDGIFAKYTVVRRPLR